VEGDAVTTVQEALIKATEPMLHNQLRNYIMPGLTSYLVGSEKKGSVRLFHSERECMEFVTPHSHRFDFTCLVLSGDVLNTIFRPGYAYDDAWCLSSINQVCGKDGLNEYTHIRGTEASHWRAEIFKFSTGDVYSMTHEEIHSIKFSKGAKVLFFEGPQLKTTSYMIEPWENGKCIPTFRTEPWMFERGENHDV
jgi:hypothetical protein